MDLLARLIPHYPTLHRSLHTPIASYALRFLDGSTMSPASQLLLDAASNLYSTLQVIGGRVNAGAIWRKSLDEAVSFTLTAFYGLRTTFNGVS
jgi:hypothetical protein